MKGSTPPQIAEIIIKLVKDMAAVSPPCFNRPFLSLLLVSFDVEPMFCPLVLLPAVFRATSQTLGPESPKMQ